LANTIQERKGHLNSGRDQGGRKSKDRNEAKKKRRLSGHDRVPRSERYCSFSVGDASGRCYTTHPLSRRLPARTRWKRI